MRAPNSPRTPIASQPLTSSTASNRANSRSTAPARGNRHDRQRPHPPLPDHGRCAQTTVNSESSQNSPNRNGKGCCKSLCGRASKRVVFLDESPAPEIGGRGSAMARQPGFFDGEERLKALSAAGNPLERWDRRRVLAAVFAAMACSVGTAFAQPATPSQSPIIAPPSSPARPPRPPPRQELRPPRPTGPRRWYWSRGRWQWNGRHWVWLSGSWRIRR